VPNKKEAMQMDRGVIAAPGIIRPLEQGFVVERSISNEELRYYILYWDKVVIPGNNMVYIAVPEEDELIASQAIVRPKVQFHGTYQGNQFTEAILGCQAIVAEKLMQDKTVDWVIHQIGDSLTLPPNFVTQRDTIRVTLVNVLPVPNAEIPIQEILKFKQNRKDELTELHDSIDELYFEVLNSPDKSLATKKAVLRFQSAIQNIDKTAHEGFKKTRKYDLSVELNLDGKDIIAGASAGTLIGFFGGGFSIPIAAVIGAVVPMIKINAKANYTFEPAKRNTKLSYISKASRDEIIK
jgi:hypothetical protein